MTLYRLEIKPGVFERLEFETVLRKLRLLTEAGVILLDVAIADEVKIPSPRPSIVVSR